MIHIIDDFLEDPIERRQNALEQDFGLIYLQGNRYENCCTSEDDEIFNLIQNKLEAEIKPVLHGYRLSYAGQTNPTWIHSDKNLSTWAAVLYLNPFPPENNGTSFWHYKDHDWEAPPSMKELNDLGFCVPEVIYETMKMDGFSKEKWSKRFTVPGDFNRLIIYPSELFHAMEPRLGFGTSKETARLVEVFFFN